MVTFTKPGRFNVRVVNANNEKNYSDWNVINGKVSDNSIDTLTLEADEIVNADEDTVFFIEGNYIVG